MMRWLSPDYKQPKPFKIYVMGPNDALCDMLFSGTRAWISALDNKTGDVAEPTDEYAPKNELRVRRAARTDCDAQLRYVLVNDSTLVKTSATPELIGDEIDAYILVFLITDGAQFSALYSDISARVVRLCAAQYDAARGPQKTIFICAHRPNVYSSEQGFKADDMSAMLRNTRAVYHYENLNQPAGCNGAVDLVVSELYRQHARWFRQRTAAADAAAAADAGPRSGWMDAITALLPTCGGQ